MRPYAAHLLQRPGGLRARPRTRFEPAPWLPLDGLRPAARGDVDTPATIAADGMALERVTPEPDAVHASGRARDDAGTAGRDDAAATRVPDGDRATPGHPAAMTTSAQSPGPEAPPPAVLGMAAARRTPPVPAARQEPAVRAGEGSSAAPPGEGPIAVPAPLGMRPAPAGQTGGGSSAGTLGAEPIAGLAPGSRASAPALAPSPAPAPASTPLPPRTRTAAAEPGGAAAPPPTPPAPEQSQAPKWSSAGPAGAEPIAELALGARDNPSAAAAPARAPAAAAPAPALPPAPPRAPEPPGQVTVTIGRIELHAPSPAPRAGAPAARAPRRRPPSLDEYLRDRARGSAG